MRTLEDMIRDSIIPSSVSWADVESTFSIDLMIEVLKIMSYVSSFRKEHALRQIFITVLPSPKIDDIWGARYFQRLIISSKEGCSQPSKASIACLGNRLIMKIFYFLPYRGLECIGVPGLDRVAFLKINRASITPQISLDID